MKKKKNSNTEREAKGKEMVRKNAGVNPQDEERHIASKEGIGKCR